MNLPPSTPICILAGGASRRFGENKALAMLSGKPLIQHLIERVAPQTSGPVAINTPDPARFADLGLKALPDEKWEGAGPLAGIRTAMQWANDQGFEQIITLAVDQPFAPLDFVEKLARHGAPAISATADRWHPVNALWRSDQVPALDSYLEGGGRAVHGWAKHCSAKAVEFDLDPAGLDPFWNVNSKDDMEQAERMLSGQSKP